VFGINASRFGSVETAMFGFGVPIRQNANRIGGARGLDTNRRECGRTRESHDKPAACRHRTTFAIAVRLGISLFG
jgi:hypothetical protein